MADEPEVRGGTRQPSGRFALDFHLNDGFVTAVGTAKAEAFLAMLNDVADRMAGADRAHVEAELRRRMTELEVRVSAVEIDSFADEISRSDGTVQAHEHNPYDPDVHRRDA